jgi:hypothetical protein
VHALPFVSMHVPTEPATLHALPLVQLALLQQTPSTQLPLWH